VTHLPGCFSKMRHKLVRLVVGVGSRVGRWVRIIKEKGQDRVKPDLPYDDMVTQAVRESASLWGDCAPEAFV